MKCKVCGNNVPVDDSLRRASCCKCNTVYVRREVAYVCYRCSRTYHFFYQFVTEEEYNKKNFVSIVNICPECKGE